MRAVLSVVLRTQHSIVVHKLFYRKTTEAEQGLEAQFFVFEAASCTAYFAKCIPLRVSQDSPRVWTKKPQYKLRAIGSWFKNSTQLTWL